MSEILKPPPIRASDGCRTRKRKCDGARPYCSNCIRTSTRDAVGNPICSYSALTKKRGPKKGYKETLLQRLESLEAILNPLSKNEASKEKLEATSQWASKQPDHILNMLVLKDIPNQPILGQQNFPFEEEYELHLLRLGLLYSNLSTNYRLSLIQGQDFQIHQKSVHSSLRMALCANGVFYSNHPYLMSMVDKDSNQSKFEFAKRFLFQAKKMIPTEYSNEVELTDAVRTLLMIVDGYLALGEPEEASRVNGRLRELVKKEKVFQPYIFDVNQNNNWTVDDLRIIKLGIENSFKKSQLNNSDIKERFHLWEECLAIDTFTSMSSGEDFELDETLYPDEFKTQIFQFMEREAVFKIPSDYSRYCTPQMGRNTLWFNTAMASTFDDIREMTCLASSQYSNGLVKYRLSLIRTVRRAMRFSRENAIGAVHRFSDDTKTKLHAALLKQYESTPNLFLPFKSLLFFQPGSDSSSLAINNVWRSFVSFNHDLLFLFAGFAYIHLPMCDDPDRLYQLSTNDAAQFSSAEILLSMLKAVSFIIRALYTPIFGPKIHCQSPKVFENIGYAMSDTQAPAPGLATIESTVTLYIISSSCLMMSNTNPYFADETKDLIQKAVLPALDRIGHIKPMAKNYYLHLQKMLR